MKKLLMLVALIHLLALALLLASTFDNNWYQYYGPNNTKVMGFLWQQCIYSRRGVCCVGTQGCSNAWVQAVQAFMILSILASLASLAMFLVEIFKKKCGKKFYIPGLLQCSAGLCALIAASIYTGRSNANHWAGACQNNFTLVNSGQPCFNVTLYHQGHNGTPFFLAWSTVPLLIISGLLYTFIEKQESFPAMATK